MPRVLVILPTSSYRTPDFVAAAEALGVELAIASEEEPPLDMGDRFVRVDCSDPEKAAAAIVEHADTTPIDAVVAADDAGVLAAALASERLGLDHHPPSAAAATRDKLAMRRLLDRSEVPQPGYLPVPEGEEEAALGRAAHEFGYPLVLKPRTGSASQGVVRVDGPADHDEARATVRRVADSLGESGPLVVEKLITGSEVALEGMVVGGDLTTLAVFDKPDTPTGPTFPETLLVTPSRHTAAELEELGRVVAAATTALDLRHGPVHAEAIIDGRGHVHLLEVAARSIGGLCGRSLRFGLMNTSLEQLILATALGRPPTQHRQPGGSGVMMLPVERAGVLEGVGGLEEARNMEGIVEIDITIPPGTEVRPLPDGDRYLGFVFGVGADAAEAEQRIRRAVAVLDVRIR